MAEDKVKVVNIPLYETEKVEPKPVDTEVHIQKVELPPVEVTFREPPRITIRLNDKIPDLSALLRDKTE